MSQVASHPGRSADFLSRLHDGDLTPAERAQFESHRAHCVECRNAAFDFEAALSLYRSSRPKAPTPDLSARILRRLQQSNRRSPPLGGSVGLNLRWAGAFAAAILAAIIGFSVVARQEAVRHAAMRGEPVPVVIDGKLQANEARKPQSLVRVPVPVPSSPKQPLAEPRREFAPDKPALDKGKGLQGLQDQFNVDKSDKSDKDEKAARSDNLRAGPSTSTSNSPEHGQVFGGAPAPPSAPAPATAATTTTTTTAKESGLKEKKTLAKAQEPTASQLDAAAAVGTAGGRASSAPGERQGGEGAASSVAESRDAEAPLRITITAADGGAQPELTSNEKLDLPFSERGQEYTLTVDSQGHVSDVRRVEHRRQVSENALRAKPDSAVDAPPPPALKQLRFRAADRPRLLRVTIE